MSVILFLSYDHVAGLLKSRRREDIQSLAESKLDILLLTFLLSLIDTHNFPNH